MTIGIRGAIDEDIIRLLKKLNTENVEKQARYSFTRNGLAGKRVVICKSGVVDGQTKAPVLAGALL